MIETIITPKSQNRLGERSFTFVQRPKRILRRNPFRIYFASRAGTHILVRAKNIAQAREYLKEEFGRRFKWAVRSFKREDICHICKFTRNKPVCTLASY